MTRNAGIARRDLLKGAAAVACGAPLLVPASARGANDRIQTGIIGLGGPAGGGAGQVIAVCDVREDKLARHRQNKNVSIYKDFRQLLTREDIDAVLIGTPDHWHALPAIAAAKAGKDIYCEKPMSLTIREARAMVRAVRRYERVFQTGSQQRSSREFRFACEMVRNGRIGRLKTIEVHVGGPSGEQNPPAEPVPPDVDWDMWLGPAPWRPFSRRILTGWRGYRDYSGGGMTDWGAHHFDIAQWALDMDESGPVEIIPPDGKDVPFLTFVYGNGVTVTHGGPTGGGWGVVFHGSEGRIGVNRGKLQTWPETIMAKPTAPDEVHLYNSPGQKEDWLRCIRTRQKPICDVEVGCRSVTVCHLGNIAYWLKRPLKWDPRKEEFVGDAGANRFLDRAKREPWSLS